MRMLTQNSTSVGVASQLRLSREGSFAIILTSLVGQSFNFAKRREKPTNKPTLRSNRPNLESEGFSKEIILTLSITNFGRIKFNDYFGEEEWLKG